MTRAPAGDSADTGDVISADDGDGLSANVDAAGIGESQAGDTCDAGQPDAFAGQVGLSLPDGSWLPCPQPKLAIDQGEQVQVATKVVISGLGTVAWPCRPIVSWQWTVKCKPAGSNAVVPLSFNEPVLKLVADVAGMYTVCLHVVDAASVLSCADGCVAFVAVP